MPAGLTNLDEPTERVIQLVDQIMNITFMEASQLSTLSTPLHSLLPPSLLFSIILLRISLRVTIGDRYFNIAYNFTFLPISFLHANTSSFSPSFLPLLLLLARLMGKRLGTAGMQPRMMMGAAVAAAPAPDAAAAAAAAPAADVRFRTILIQISVTNCFGKLYFQPFI